MRIWEPPGYRRADLLDTSIVDQARKLIPGGQQAIHGPHASCAILGWPASSASVLETYNSLASR